MNKEKIKVITDREDLYDKCENMEQVFDSYYLPLLDIHYKKTYELQNDIKTLLKENEAKEKVIKKQDYVINELEKWLKEYSEKDTMSSIIFGVVLNHLIDLKGENNEKD